MIETGKGCRVCLPGVREAETCGETYCPICESIIDDECDGLVDGYPSPVGREERGFD